jgi:hypothetical protein
MQHASSATQLQTRINSAMPTETPDKYSNAVLNSSNPILPATTVPTRRSRYPCHLVSDAASALKLTKAELGYTCHPQVESSPSFPPQVAERELLPPTTLDQPFLPFTPRRLSVPRDAFLPRHRRRARLLPRLTLTRPPSSLDIANEPRSSPN